VHKALFGKVSPRFNQSLHKLILLFLNRMVALLLLRLNRRENTMDDASDPPAKNYRDKSAFLRDV
jgi:hypothetical protein